MTRQLDILRMSDAFRRVGSPLRRNSDVCKVVRLGRMVAAQAGRYVGPEDEIPGGRMHAEQILQKSVADLASAAKSQGYDKVILPLSAKNNWVGNFQSQIIDPAEKLSGVHIALQESTFVPNYADAEEGIETCLDEGYRGMADIVFPSQAEEFHV